MGASPYIDVEGVFRYVLYPDQRARLKPPTEEPPADGSPVRRREVFLKASERRIVEDLRRDGFQPDPEVHKDYPFLTPPKHLNRFHLFAGFELSR